MMISFVSTSEKIEKKIMFTPLSNNFCQEIADAPKRTDIIESDKLLDGVCVFITNHIERQETGFKVNPRKVIRAYRNKTKIEDVFKNVKSFLKIRPFFVNTENHVKAVYTICILASFLNKFLANKRKAIGEKDYLNSKELYAPFKNIDFVTLFDKISGETVTKS